MQFPAELRYSREHEWVRVEDGAAVVGVTDFAQDQLGDVVFVSLPAVGSKVAALEKMGEIESVKSVSELYSPVSGTVVEINQAAVDSPETINRDAYGEGWLLRVAMDGGLPDGLLSADEYRAVVGAE